MNHTQTNLLKEHIKHLEDQFSKSNLSTEKTIYRKEINDLLNIFNIKKIYVLDTFDNQVHEYYYTKDAHRAMCKKLGYTFPINSIARNKYRNNKIEKRFYISNTSNFNFVHKKETISETILDDKPSYINDRTSKKWYKNKTRITTNKK